LSSNFAYDFSAILDDADALLIVPPFAKLDWACLALHILQACARKAGFTVQVFYANLAMARWIGEANYQRLCDKGYVGEILFGRHVYKNDINRNVKMELMDESAVEIDDQLKIWVHALMDAVLKKKYRVLGCSTTYQQINSSITLINYVKQIRPEIVTVLGGANCQGEVGRALFSLSNQMDYIFSGESELAFTDFLKDIIRNGRYPQERIIPEKCCDINEIPVPDYDDYLRQFKYFLPKSSVYQNNQYFLSYETSRGCWWGQKHRCFFCGAMVDMNYREKSPQKVISELHDLRNKYHVKNIMMTDLIMPYKYIHSLVPRLIDEKLHLTIFYEVKSNLSFEQLILLKRAGICKFQPGIETLSSSLLEKMNKGVSARQNIIFLRNTRTIGIELSWSFLYMFPKDTEDEYQEIKVILPLISHLSPPNRIQPISTMRFSPLYKFPEKFGITKTIANLNYQYCFPEAIISDIACFHQGDYACFGKPEEPLIQEIIGMLNIWQKKWQHKEQPKLKLVVNSRQKFLLIDTRGLDEPILQTISYKQAAVIMMDRPVTSVSRDLQDEIAWGLKHKFLIELDSWYVSLVTANPELVSFFIKENDMTSNPINEKMSPGIVLGR
jgi:ribosomal peptide maturation radical SAM protein 1